MKQVVLLTDFGKDFFVGILKGILAKEQVPFIDLTHDIDSFDIFQAAYILFLSYKYFPKGSIFLTIIDPTVGISTKRKPILANIEDKYFYIGPDNGILSYFFNRNLVKEAYIISNRSYSTFDARDVFTPFAVDFYKNRVDFQKLKKLKIEELIRFKENLIKRESYLEGEIVYIDKFGNCISNINKKDINFKIDYIKIANLIYKDIYLSYFNLKDSGPLFNSWDYLEFATFKDNYSKKFNIALKEKVYIYGIT